MINNLLKPKPPQGQQLLREASPSIMKIYEEVNDILDETRKERQMSSSMADQLIKKSKTNRGYRINRGGEDSPFVFTSFDMENADLDLQKKFKDASGKEKATPNLSPN